MGKRTRVAIALLLSTPGLAYGLVPHVAELFRVTTPDGRPLEVRALTVAVDADDDDENGIVDALETEHVPTRHLPHVVVTGQAQVTLSFSPSIRLLRDGRPVASPLTLEPRALPATFEVQGLAASRVDGDAEIVARTSDGTRRLPVTVVGIAMLDARNAPIDAWRDAVGISHEITNDGTLPRGASWQRTSPDPDNVRVELFDSSIEGDTATAVVESFDDGTLRASRSVTLTRPDRTSPFRSPWLRLVGDDMDLGAPGVGTQLLRVGLRDEVRVRYATPRGDAVQTVRVGRPGDEDGPRAARRARVRTFVLRPSASAPPVIGTDVTSAERIARDQVRIANEIWLQCFVTLGDPDEAEVHVVPVPPPSLLAIADGDGLHAAGGGVIRLRVNGRAIAPVPTRANATPLDTALAVARAIRALRFRTSVTENVPTEFGAGPTADIVVRSDNGELATLTQDGSAPLGTDAMQRVRIGVVDLGDGIQEFDNMSASSGTLEERALLKALSDDDPSTVELFVVNRFSQGTRQGEAFIEGEGGALVNALILDRNGMRQQREAWTQSHELGHILMNQPFHPDNVGMDRPWLLMDADNSAGMVGGPKRLTWDECHRTTDESGVGAIPALLSREDARRVPPTEVSGPYDRGYPRPR